MMACLALALIAAGAAHFCVDSPQQPAELAVPDTPLAKMALLVGIDEYSPDSKPPIEPLAGAVNDVRRVRELVLAPRASSLAGPIPAGQATAGSEVHG